ncbi:putative efflux pump antibiotic resistance protein [Delitschia confertaspora ATCC 74209]|uniref:Efflux pump antibiotic resistance protein n=1 Tax=Delitschia confertaspora ATCC 74209 TaxID=1513339 RepID=A0A9P4MXC9_9PLEO|nr:putative efflux pump antibiotic resistance protein [Delitschia confertaspora ATCC 74209]
MEPEFLSEKTAPADISSNIPDATSSTPEPPRTVQGFAWILILLSILSCTFLYGLDQTIVANVQPAIVSRFDSLSELAWISVAFLLAAASSNLFWGQMYGRFNVKYLYMTCVLLFEVGSAICGAAPSMAALIVGRAICGFGGAGMYTGSMTLLSLTTTEQERAFYLGLPGITWGAGTVLGPILGGAFTDSSAGWRWAFYINLVIGAVFAPVYVWLVPSKDMQPGKSMKERIKGVDLLGFVLMTGTFTAGLMAISFGGTEYAWDSAQIIALFVVAGVVTAMYWTQQYFAFGVAREHVSFPLVFLKNADLLLVALVEASAITATFIPIYFLPLFFAFVHGDSPMMTGVRLLPYVVFVVFTCLLSGHVVSKNGQWLPWFLGGGILVLAGSAAMYTVNEHTSKANVYGYSVLLGLGAGSYLQLPFAVAQMKVDPVYITGAVGFMAFAQLSAPSVTMAIAEAVFLNEASGQIQQILPNMSLEDIHRIISGLGGDQLASLGQATIQRVIHIIVRNISKAYILCFVGAGVTILISVYFGVSELGRRKKTGKKGTVEDGAS